MLPCQESATRFMIVKYFVKHLRLAGVKGTGNGSSIGFGNLFIVQLRKGMPGNGRLTDNEGGDPDQAGSLCSDSIKSHLSTQIRSDERKTLTLSCPAQATTCRFAGSSRA